MQAQNWVMKLSIFKVTLPLNGDTVGELKAGDIVFLSGKLFTARDKAHARALNEGLPVKLTSLFHCGPIVKNGKVISAGPTTSARMGQYTPELISRFKISAIIGKGGMGKQVADALNGKGVYLSMTGGCGALGAEHLKIVEQKWADLGMAESVWVLEADKLGPLVVGIDARGNSLYKN